MIKIFVSTHNYTTLINRQKGELLISEKGILKKMTFLQRIGYQYFGQSKKINQELAKTIRSLTAKINTEGGLQLEDEELRDFFFTHMAPLSQKIYERDLSKQSIEILSKDITFQEKEIPQDATPLYVQAYKSAKLWAKLGNYFRLNGCSGSYQIRQGRVFGKEGLVEDARNLGIFKPSSEEPLSKNNPNLIQKIKRIIFSLIPSITTGSAWDCGAGQGYIGEVAAKKIERFLTAGIKDYLEKHPDDEYSKKLFKDLELVPDTEVGFLQIGRKYQNEKVGSFQLWVQEKHKNASEALGVRADYSGGWLRSKLSCAQAKETVPAEYFDMLVIMDYITANSDRHAENWFVLQNEQKEASGIRLIDGGWSMATDHPSKLATDELRKQYFWKHLSLSEEPFTLLGKSVIEHIFANRDQLEQSVLDLYNQQLPEEKEKNTSRVLKMRERLLILNHLKESVTKKELADIRTKSEIKSALKEAIFTQEIAKLSFEEIDSFMLLDN